MRIVCFFFFNLIALACAQAQLFTDDFSRGSDPSPLSPWIAQSGAWSITGGALKGGTNAGNSFGFLYITNSWTNYSVQARVRFSTTNADGGGIGGRLNPFSGGHYAAWISPEGSSAPHTLQLRQQSCRECHRYRVESISRRRNRCRDFHSDSSLQHVRG